MEQNVNYSPGLEGVIAAITKVGRVLGQEGRVIYRGYDIRDLAAHGSFEETVALLLDGKLPNRQELKRLEEELQANYSVSPFIIETISKLPASLPPMDVLRTAVSMLSAEDPEYGDDSPEAERRRAIRLIAKTPTLVAADARRRKGLDPVEPDPSLSIAGNFLHLLHGRRQPESEEKALDVALILHAEHGLNASTFSARVTTSTLSDMYSAVTAAVGTLKGPLHGGANEAVVHMLNELKSVDEVDEWLEQRLARKERVYGFGHRVYRVTDPRAIILRESASRIAQEVGQFEKFNIIERIRELMLEKKNLHPNVDLYSGIVYQRLGIDVEFFTPIFAISRMAGWTAHIMEQRATNRLIRPSPWYQGDDHLKYIPIDERP